MSDTDDRRLADAQWKGEVISTLKSIDDKLNSYSVRLNIHSERIGSLERSRAWFMGASAAVGAVSGWLTSHFTGNHPK